MLTTLLLGLFAVVIYRRRSVERRTGAIDKFMEWGAYEKIDR